MSFQSAQRDHDNALPSNHGITACPVCDGMGILLLTNCCNAAFIPDTDTCIKCGKDAEVTDCERCNGTGVIEV